MDDHTPSSFLILSSDTADVDQLRIEADSLRASLSAESERVAQMGGEIARLGALLHEASVSAAAVCVERDTFKQQLDDQLKFKRGPLEAQLLDANRALYEQRLQFRSIVDAVAVQRDWLREWALQAQENQRLRDILAHREAGTEVAELRRALLDAQTKFAEQTLGNQQRDATAAVQESRARALGLEVDRLTANNTLLQEQVKRLWKRVFATDRVRDAGDSCSSSRPTKRMTAVAAGLVGN